MKNNTFFQPLLANVVTFTTHVNAQRLSSRFTLVTLKLSLLSANQHHLLDNVEWLLSRPINIAILDSPLSVYNALSVGLIGIRFLVNVIDILQYTFDGPESDWYERFCEKLYEHHYALISDAVWGTVNALSNYAAYFHIPPGVPNFLMLGFTVFDIVWINYKLDLVNQDYDTEKGNFQGDLPKLAILEGDHVNKISVLLFNRTAACLFLGALTTAFILSPPALVPICYLVCNIAIAMYLSADKYGAWKEEQWKEVQLMKHGEQRAWNDLVCTMAKNTIMPFIYLGAFTASVPAGIALTVAYMAYEAGLLTRVPDVFPTSCNANASV